MLELKGLTKQFGETVAVNGVELGLKKGELCCIVGDSGSGKTTLLQMLGGSEAPTAGDVLLDGNSIFEDVSAHRAKHVGFVYQDFNLIEGLSVEENVLLGAELCGKTVSREAVRELLRSLGISRLEQKVETLSGGEKQRVTLARALFKGADVILADEPTGNLDPTNADKIFSLLRELKEGRYVVVVTHDVERAARYADRIVHLSAGRVDEDRAIPREQPKAKAAEPSVFPSGGRKLRPLSTLAANSLRRRWVRVLLIALVMALSISTITMALELQGLGNQVEGNVNINYLESDLLTVYYRDVNWSMTNTPPKFTAEDIAALAAEYGTEAFVGHYTWTGFYVTRKLDNSLGDQVTANGLTIKTVKLNEFFEERIMSYDIEGRFPTAPGEIIIAEDAAEKLFGQESAIGQKVYLRQNSTAVIPVTVVGINHTVNPQEKIYTVVSDVDAALLAGMTVENIIETGTFDGMLLVSGRALVTVGEASGAEALVYGRMPSAPGEVLVSESFFAGGEYKGQAMPGWEKFESGSIPASFYEPYMGTVFALGAMEAALEQPITVVGVYHEENCAPDEEGNLPRYVLFSEAGWDDLYTPRFGAVELYFGNADKALEVKESVTREKNLKAEAKVENLRERVENWSVLYTLVVGAIGLVLIFILIITLLTFSKILIAERKQEIAILRSLGARGGQIVRLVLFDFGIIYVVAAAMSALLAILFPSVLGNVIAGALPYVVAKYPALTLLLTNAAALPLLLLLSLPTLVRMLRITPATLLKRYA